MSAQPAPNHPSSNTPSKPRVLALKFHGSGVDLAVIILKNVLLTVLTLGIYSFWGKVNVRKFLWHNTEFHGQRLTYHGTGGELLRGYSKVIGIVIGMQLLMQGAMLVSQGAGLALSAAMGLVFAFLVPYAIYQSQRYLYSRTTWRGIRFGMSSNAKPFVAAFIKGYVLTLVTLGLYSPIWQNRLYAIRMDNSRIGSARVRYTGKDGEVFSIFLKSLPLIIVTLGIYLFWYAAKISVYRSEHTWIGSPTLGAARGHLQMTGGEYFKLSIVNIVCVLVTFGLAIPWVIAHNLSFMLSRFSFVGQLNVDSIKQVASNGSGAADGMADALDVGFGM